MCDGFDFLERDPDASESLRLVKVSGESFGAPARPHASVCCPATTAQIQSERHCLQRSIRLLLQSPSSATLRWSATASICANEQRDNEFVVPPMFADHCALAVMVKVPEATALLEYPLATAMAFKVVVDETVSGPVYRFDAGVGLVPSIV